MSPPAPLRALVGARVSIVKGPQKVSHVAQRETGTKYAVDKGYEIIGSVQDLGVSATVAPFKRPDLGPWLTDEKSHEWDVLVFSKLDRLFRSTRDCVKFAEWAEEHRKVLVFAEDGLTLNYREDRDRASIDGMMAELFVYLGSFFAQLELNRFKTRALDGHRVLRQTDRWASGVPPLGFKVVDHPSGKGKGLERDTDGYRLLHDMAEKLLDGWSFVKITRWLNETGAQTNKAKAGGRSSTWTVATVIDVLTSLRTQGLKMHRGETVLDGDGEPIMLARPTFDDDTWQKIQQAATLRKQNQRTPTGSVNPMLGIGVCGRCGRSLAQHFSGERRYYRCAKKCAQVFLRAEIGDDLLEEAFLDHYGDEKVTRRVFVKGEDHTHELEKVNATIARLRREQDAGLIVSEDDERIYIERMRAQIQRRTELEVMPATVSGWVVEETDQTYREVWPASDRRQLLLDRAVKFVIWRGNPPEFDLYVPDDKIPLPMRIGIENRWT